MESLPYAQLERGTFLISSPEIDAGLFFRGVILLCEHTPSGSFGLIINKPLDIEIPPELINITDASNPSIGLRAGGPLQTNQMMILHDSPDIPEQTLRVCDGIYLGGDLDFLQEIINDSQGPRVRLCFGYVGWDAGQLEREFLDGQWYLKGASSNHLFEVAPEKLWQTLLKEMGGKYATLSMIPEDLSLN